MATTRELFESAKRAIESRDDAAMLELFDDRAELLMYSVRNPPATPLRATGPKEIREALAAPPEVREKVEDPVIGDGRFAFEEICTYPSGQKVVSTNICEVADGKIHKMISTQAWDE